VKLDFIVIGAQKGGTTSLWQYLREHPRICMPMSKEMAFFTRPDPNLAEFHAGVATVFADAPRDALLGKVTPDYMIGQPGAPVEVVAARIAAALPDVKLIAVLRDPIERAVSSYVMAVRREEEMRSLDAALGDQLSPDELTGARLRPTPTSSYLVAGEYGRILAAYRGLVPAERLLVTFSRDLADNTGRVLDGVLEFLGLETGFRPEGIDIRHFRGGTRKLLDPGAEEMLRRFHREQVLPRMRGSAAMNRLMFSFFYETWNVAPDDESPPLAPDLRARLEAHFEQDAERLAQLGVRAPWIERWGASTGGADQARGA
jgi:sulfotransferase family protein